MRSATLRFLALVVGVLLIGGAAPVQGQGAFGHGTVVALQGTPHLWIADDRGVLHWGGDTRALSGKHVNWNDRRDVSLAELQTYPIGDPWLSAGLLKDGDPIYQVKWETDWPQPQLLHIQSIKDVELFGINGSNYGNYVIDRAAWEQRYGIEASTLERHPLASAVPPGVTLTLNRVPGGGPAPALAPTVVSWVPPDAAAIGEPRTVYYDGDTLEVTVVEVKRNANAYLRDLHRTYITPPAGQEDVGVRVRIRYLAGPIGSEIALVPIVPTCAVWGRYTQTCLQRGAKDLLQFRTQAGEEPHARGYHGVLPVLRTSTWINRPNDGWRTFRVPQGTPFVMVFKGEAGADTDAEQDTVFRLD